MTSEGPQKHDRAGPPSREAGLFLLGAVGLGLAVAGTRRRSPTGRVLVVVGIALASRALRDYGRAVPRTSVRETAKRGVHRRGAVRQTISRLMPPRRVGPVPCVRGSAVQAPIGVTGATNGYAAPDSSGPPRRRFPLTPRSAAAVSGNVVTPPE